MSDEPTEKPHQPIALRVISLLAASSWAIAFGSVLIAVLTNGYIDGGTTIGLTSDQAASFRVQPGRYALVAQAPNQDSTASSITCSDTQADGSVIDITPHFKVFPSPLLPHFASSTLSTYRLADLTVTQPNPSLTCHGTWSSMKLVPLVTAGFQGASRWILLGFLFLGFIYVFTSIRREKHPATSNNGLWYGLVALTFLVSVCFYFAPFAIDAKTADHTSGQLPKIPDCSLDNLSVVAYNNATGLSFDKAYLLQDVGITFCLSVPQPFTLPVSTPLPDGQPMVLLLTQSYSWYSGGGSFMVDATSNGGPVTGISDFLVLGDFVPTLSTLHSILDPVQPADAINPLTTTYLAYATADPSHLSVTITFPLSTGKLVATFIQ